MRIAINVEQLLHRSPGGIGRYTARLASLLPGLFPADEVMAFAARHPRSVLDAAASAIGGLPVHALALPRPVLYDCWHLLGWPPVAGGPGSGGHGKGAVVDLVHAPSLAVPPRSGAALVVTVHDAAPVLFPEAFSARGRWFHHLGLAAAARRADRVITVSQAAAAEIAEHTAIPAERIRVVPNGVDPVAVSADQRARTLTRLDLAGGPPYVLWVGSLEPRKGVGTLVAAMARLARRAGSGEAARARLVLAGYRGWRAEGLVDEADVAALGDRLRRLGPVGEDDLWDLYAGAAVAALPSRHEGFGLPALEAMSQGTPVACSDIPALRELTGGAARLVPPGDVDAWADAIADLLEDEAQRVALGAAGRARSRQFSWETTVRATHQVYEEASR